MTFELYPAIDLLGAKVVRLRQGDYGAETQYSSDPAEVARGFATAGAQWIHVVDLDAARDGGAANLDSIAAICEAVPECNVQTGGGVRTIDAARKRVACGVHRVIVGSAAVDHPELVSDLVSELSNRVVVGLDVRGREVSTHGWTRGAGHNVHDLVQSFSESGAAAFVVTQINVDGLLTGSDVELYRELLELTTVPLIASGGVGSLNDIEALRLTEVSGRTLAGVIAGKALYEGRFTVAEGLAACSQRA